MCCERSSSAAISASSWGMSGAFQRNRNVRGTPDGHPVCSELAVGSAQLGLLRVRVLLALGDSGVADFVCHAENGTADVPARFGFGRGFRRIILRRVVHLVVDVDEGAENDRYRSPWMQPAEPNSAIAAIGGLERCASSVC